MSSLKETSVSSQGRGREADPTMRTLHGESAASLWSAVMVSCTAVAMSVS